MNKVQAEEKKQIKKEVYSRIRSGEPKQQILEELSKKYKDKITIVKQLEVTPSLAMRKKYQLFNLIMTGLLLTILVLDVILVINSTLENWLKYVPFLNVFIDIILLIGILRYRIENYSWIAARAIVSVIYIIISNAYFHFPIDVITIIVLGLIIISFFLGIFLSMRLCPPRIPKTIEVDIDGTEKINKTIYVFPD